MRNANVTPLMITLLEAVRLSEYTTLESAERVSALWRSWQCHMKAAGACDPDPLWEFISALAFVYDVGRVQGIREERARKKSATAPI